MASEAATVLLTVVGIALLVVGIMLLTQRTLVEKDRKDKKDKRDREYEKEEIIVYPSWLQGRGGWPLHPQGRGGWPVYYSPLPLRPIVF
jgi:hypothetical protein